MSTASKITLGITSLSAIGIVVFVHFTQRWDQEAMHAGVIRDMEQQKIKRERLLDFQMQQSLENEYRKVQTVSESKEPGKE